MNSVTCMAPTKTFNIAGLNSAAVMIPNPVLRHKVWRALNTDEVAEPNAFAMDATLAAFNEGEPWLNELRAYLAGNKATARAMFDKYNASVPATGASSWSKDMPPTCCGSTVRPSRMTRMRCAIISNASIR